MEISDVIQLILLITTAVVAVIGFALTIIQLNINNKIVSAQFVNSLIEKLRFDESIQKAASAIDYNRPWYDETFHGSPREKDFDAFFSTLDYVCMLYHNKVISEINMIPFKYEIKRVSTDFGSRAYLWNIWMFSKKQKTDCSFHYLINFIFEGTEITNFENSKEYPKYLNF